MAEDAKPAGPEFEDAPQDIVDPPAQELPAEQPPLDAVVVVKVVTDDGISVTVHNHGSVQATEVQTLLELAVPSWREKIGLPAR